MAESTKLQPSFEDVLQILSHVPQDKLLSLKHKLKYFVFGASSKLLQAMILLTLGREGDARICLDALGDNPAAQYVHQTQLGAAGVKENGEDLHPPQLDKAAMELLAQIYSLLAEEKLCSHEVMTKVQQAAQEDVLSTVPPKEQGNHSPAASLEPGGSFQPLRSDVDVGFAHKPNPNYVVRSSPLQIGGNLDLSGPRSLHSFGTPSFSTQLEISASPTVVFHTQPSPSPPPSSDQPCGKSTSGSEHIKRDGENHSSQGTSRTSSHPGQDMGVHSPQGPHMKKVPQISSFHPAFPVPETHLPSLGAENQPVETSDASSVVEAEPHPAEENKKQDEKSFSKSLPNSGTMGDTGPVQTSMADFIIPADTASIPAHSHPPLTSSFSSTLPSPPPGGASTFPHHPSLPSPAHPPPLHPVEAEPDIGKFFTFVVLHAGEDEIVAHRVKNLLEKMGVPDGATLAGDFLIAGRSHLTCFQDALENSAFIILLLTKNFLCNLCMFQANTALMESIEKSSKQDSVIPFIPKENPLEQDELPTTLCVLTPLDENSCGFSKTVQNTFSPSRISKRKAVWDMMQRKKLQQYQEHYKNLPNVAALSLGSQNQVPPPA
ncbi:TCAM1 protein, partial [Turnix velox]|nr:TCAM1 protein [Turnix velox]